MKLGRMIESLGESRTLRPWSKRLYRRRFQRPFGDDNLYYGVYPDHETALAAARELSSRALPASYDIEAAGRVYLSQLDKLMVSDYPLLYWISRLLSCGQRSIFDLGGNIGVTYYGFGQFLEYPKDLAWHVHDLPKVTAAGRKWAIEHDPSRRLHFADHPEDASGHDVLISTGALQYLGYTLPELLQRLAKPPPHVMINLTPMHPEHGYFTLQNMTFAICPYRVMARAQLVRDMEALGYRTVDQWISLERHLKVPFESASATGEYSGFHFSRD